MRLRVVVGVALAAGLAAGPAGAASDGPLSTPGPAPPTVPRTAEIAYQEGLTFQAQGRWYLAEAAFREAVERRPAFPEAWNGLGYALRRQRKFDESVRAYHEALRLRPQYPRALEYLGEAYVQMGRLDDARAILERLRPLDELEAAALARAIEGAAGR